MRRLTTAIRSEKRVITRFRPSANVTECAYTNRYSIAYCTPRLYGIVLYCIVVGSRRLMPPGCTAAEGLLYKPWSLVVPTFTARCLHPSSERRNY